MKNLLIAILLATTRLTVSAKETTPLESQPIHQENIVIPNNTSEEFFWVHCRIGADPITGNRVVLFCRTEISRGGVTKITGYLLESQYPPGLLDDNTNSGSGSLLPAFLEPADYYYNY